MLIKWGWGDGARLGQSCWSNKHWESSKVSCVADLGAIKMNL